MSQEDVERARLAYRRFNEVGEFLPEFVDPDCEFDYSHAMPDVAAFTGIEQANAVLREWSSPFEDFYIEADRIIDLEDDRVAVFVRNGGTLGGAKVENHFLHVWTVRDGKGIRLVGYLDDGNALEAAGLK